MTVENRTDVVENNLLAGLKDIDPESELNNASIAVEMAIEADDFKKKYLDSMKTSKKEVDDVLWEVGKLKDLENELEEWYTNPRYREELKQAYETLSWHSSKMWSVIDLYDAELAKIESWVVNKNSIDKKGAQTNKETFEKYAEEAKAIKEKLPELREKIENLKRDQEMQKAIDKANEQNQRLQEENQWLKEENQGLKEENQWLKEEQERLERERQEQERQEQERQEQERLEKERQEQERRRQKKQKPKKEEKKDDGKKENLGQGTEEFDVNNVF